MLEPTAPDKVPVDFGRLNRPPVSARSSPKPSDYGGRPARIDPRSPWGQTQKSRHATGKSALPLIAVGSRTSAINKMSKRVTPRNAARTREENERIHL